MLLLREERKKHDDNFRSFFKAIYRNNVSLKESKTVSLVDSTKILRYLLKYDCIISDPN